MKRVAFKAASPDGALIPDVGTLGLLIWPTPPDKREQASASHPICLC